MGLSFLWVCGLLGVAAVRALKVQGFKGSGVRAQQYKIGFWGWFLGCLKVNASENSGFIPQSLLGTAFWVPAYVQHVGRKWVEASRGFRSGCRKVKALEFKRPGMRRPNL